ncbi:paternally-expressed gene 3 protein isoform X2 [Sorex araneus]|uniref:paternally-expressed gene 3 protein isoform X2 n=1 Tax=Sorex araneus TaxID=42254 RepID=UPI0024336AEE|nr:paternally-expressed gene 3 protein isoform X2 [Sorex araneus]XP_055001277.1 paternally-expressed gene 3 protein isoform X2 [Sorex araneus]
MRARNMCHASFGSSSEYSAKDMDAMSNQDDVDLAEDREPQNPIQDNMENYRKLLSLGVQLAENDGHSYMTQGHSSRSKRSAYPSTSRGLKTVSEAKKATHRRGICEDESSHGVIMEKFIKDVSRSSKAGRARDSNDRSQRCPRRPENVWKGLSFTKRGSVIRERGYEANASGGVGFHLNSTLVSKKRVTERKRRYQCDTEGQGSTHDQKGYARKRPFECGEMRKAMSLGSLSSPSFTESQPVDFTVMPYVCDECGRCFSVISEFVEHQIMHTRENLYEYGESFIHSVAVSEVQKRQAGGKCFECKECGETFSKSTTLAEHREIHAREHLANCKDEEYEEPFMPSPTFSELQKMYGKDKFYECKVCKETFLHSSALIEHQKIHGRGNFSDVKDNERREIFKPSTSLHELQKMYGKEKLYECQVCAEAFHHSASLKEHQKIHIRGKSFENKGKVCEKTFIPGQKRHQKTFSRDKFYGFKDDGNAFMPSSNLSEHLKILSRKNLYEGRSYEKSVIRNLPFTESQKSHTITRPPEHEEEEKAFTISSNPDESQKFPMKEKIYERKPYERSVIHSLAFAEAQKSHSAGSPSRPKAMAESTIQSADVAEHQKVYAGENPSERKTSERSVIHSLGIFKWPKNRNGNEFVEHHEKGESSIYVSDFNDKQQKTLRESPNEGSKSNNYKGSVIHSVSHVKSQKTLAGEGSSEFKTDGELPVSISNICEHQKARAKKKNIECKNYEISVIQSLCFGELGAIHPREKFYKCQVCGESFVHSTDLTEHQKIHDRRKPSGMKNYERSVICSLASTSLQTNYTETQAQIRCSKKPVRLRCAEQPVQMRFAEAPAQSRCAEQPEQSRCAKVQARASCVRKPVHSKCRECGECFATIRDLGAHQKIYAQEKVHRKKLFGDAVNRGTCYDGSRQKEPQQKQPQQEELSEDEEEEEADDSVYSCKDCGLSFADQADLNDHQNVQRHYLINTCKYKQSVIHTNSISEYQQDSIGEQLYECPACGESFVHKSFLFEHQRIHEQDQFYSQGRYDESFMPPLIINPQRPHAPQKNPAGMFLQCQVCGQDFVHFSVLSEHMRTHEGENFLEQGERREEAIVPGLALPRFQRSQTKERQYECKACGELILSHSDLREHLRVHERDELYDYGVSFVYTSFLTEPPKRDLPFYECKDCCKSFIHNTVLTKHQKLHKESQDVKTDMLLPRVDLQIRGSNVEIAEQEVKADKPNGEAEGLDGEAAEPNREAEQPGGKVEQPRGDANEPDGAGIEDPEKRAEEPEEDVDEPDSAGIEDPEEEDEDEEIEIEEPSYDCRECGETFTDNSAHREHLTARARVIVCEAGSTYGESSCYAASAVSTSTGTGDNKHFNCDVCGQLFGDHLSLARHQNTHIG